jgi:hypothetical protein
MTHAEFKVGWIWLADKNGGEKGEKRLTAYGLAAKRRKRRRKMNFKRPGKDICAVS